ncbi:hypothetical protein CYMTET_42688 [Cymbomonas tetramitiformis]|uniref:Deoxyhypusine hydroxylase n=1 Tax=Cymbomonas tetramitiformis TaxID=36881 RepID=A0AAE0F1E8_9CHLO|nr:hypothetical protein CYMTET_42688 [Cymbomonas tetramitiformis]
MASEVVSDLRTKLLDRSVPLPLRFRAMFSLRGVASEEAISALVEGLQDPSALFRHEIAFLLGQMQNTTSIPTLHTLLKDGNEHPMVRHEAAEALGAIATDECFELLRAYVEDPAQEVRETCNLALRRVEHQLQGKPVPPLCSCAEKERVGLANVPESGQSISAPPGGSAKEKLSAAVAGEAEREAAASPFLSVDPAPAASDDIPSEKLRTVLLDEAADMFERYSALFALRNRGNPQEVEALVEVFKSGSALLKHEVAYVLGQLQHPAALQALCLVLEDENENPMVRHEAAEALGSIAEPQCIDLLKRFLTHSEHIISESCLVALDILDYESSGAFHYADMGVDGARGDQKVC